MLTATIVHHKTLLPSGAYQKLIKRSFASIACYVLAALSMRAMKKCRYWSMLLLLAVTVSTGYAAEATSAEIVDRPVCFVNEKVITQGDVNEMAKILFYRLYQAGKAATLTEEDRQQLRVKALDQLMDNALLEQEADRLPMISIDEASLRREIVDLAYKAGRIPRLEEIQEGLKNSITQKKISQVVMFYDRLLPSIGPEDIRRRYLRDQHRYTLPSRFRYIDIAMGPANQRQMAQLADSLKTMLVRIKDENDERISVLFSDEVLQKVLAAQGEERTKLSVAVVDSLLALATSESTVRVPANEMLFQDALRLQQESTALMSAERLDAFLTSIRTELVALPGAERISRMNILAQRLSLKTDDASLWHEQGSLDAALETPLLALPVEGLSDLIQLGAVRHLLCLVEKQDAQNQSLAEVSGVISKVLERERKQQIVVALQQRLREQADIRMLAVE